MVKPLAFVTGGAGFIGSNLCERLLDEGWRVIAYDNLMLGQEAFLDPLKPRGLTFVKADLLDLDPLVEAMRGADAVFHLAANSDISYGRSYTDWDLKHGTLATYNTLEAMRRTEVKKLVFASTSAIYGEATVMPTPENYGPLLPISLYGASKLACEGLITAFAHNFDFQTWMFRFGNVVGRNGTHGALVDFINKLKADPTKLPILGDGKQAKPYVYVRELVDGMWYGFTHASEAVNVFNLTCDGASSVDRLAQAVIQAMGLTDVELVHSGGVRGWTGDVPQVRLDNRKLAALGWTPRFDSDEAVDEAARMLTQQLA